MKVAKAICIIVVVLVVVAVIGLFIFVKTFDIEKYHAQIESRLTETIGRDVKIGMMDMQISIDRGVIVSLKNVDIKDSPAFGGGSFLNAENIHVGLDLMTLIKQKAVLITSVRVRSPVVNVIRDKDGNLNIPMIKDGENVVHLPPEKLPDIRAGFSLVSDAHAQEIGKTTGGDSFNVKDLTIRSVVIQNGKFSFVDRTFSPEHTYSLSRVDVKIEMFRLNRPFPVDLRASLYSDGQNFSLKGRARVMIDEKTYFFEDAVLDLDLNNVDLGRLKEDIPLLSGIPVEDDIAGTVKADLTVLQFDQSGLGDIRGEGRVQNAKVDIRLLRYPIENIDLRFVLKGKDLELKNILFYVASGKVNGTAAVEDYLGGQSFEFQLSMEEIRIEDLVDPLLLPAEVVGKIQGNVVGGGKGMEPQKLLPTLDADGQMTVTGVKILNVNLLRLVLDRLTFLPQFIGETFSEFLAINETQIPEAMRKRMEKQNTEFRDIELAFTVNNGKLKVGETTLETEDMAVRAETEIALETLHCRIGSRVILGEELSVQMVKTISEFEALLNENKKIVIPMRTYEGPLDKVKMFPDLDFLRKTLIQTKGKDEIKKAIFKALDIERDEKASGEEGEKDVPAETGGEGAEQPRKKQPEEVIIENILDSILK